MKFRENCVGVWDKIQKLERILKLMRLDGGDDRGGEKHKYGRGCN